MKKFKERIQLVDFIVPNEENFTSKIRLSIEEPKENINFSKSIKKELEKKSLYFSLEYGKNYSLGLIPTIGTKNSECLEFLKKNNYMMINTHTFIYISDFFEDFLAKIPYHHAIFCLDEEVKLHQYIDLDRTMEYRKQIPVAVLNADMLLRYTFAEYKDINFLENYIIAIREI